MRLVSLPIIATLLLTACAPMSRQAAERACFDRARLAAHPRGTLAVGVGSGGHTAAGLSLSVSSDYIQGRDPAHVYDDCVMQKSGEWPEVPLYDRPDWKG